MGNMADTARETWRRVEYFLQRFSADRCSENAAALTYMSLFALVPLLTLLYTMATAIPTFQGAEAQLQQFLFKHLLPESGSEIENYLNDFSQQAKNLTGPGIAFLVVTAVLMLRNVEKAFNLIWRARQNRGALSSFMLYWAVLTLGPITIGLALGVGTYVTSFADSLQAYDVIGARGMLLNAAPLLLSALGFSLIYAAVPNCQVPFTHAVIGGAVAALAFNAARSLFTDLVVSSSITFIYGAFAAVPLFLLWIYLSWNIVLLGAIIVHSLSAYESDEQASRPTVLKALDLLYLFWQKQKNGESVAELDILKNRYSVIRGLDSETWGRLRELLLEKKVITQSARGNFLLARDLSGVPLWQLKEWVNDEKSLNTADLQTAEDWQDRAYSLLLGQRQNQRDALEISLAELYSQ
ncbi:MAG: YihY family inner membrane protein [Halioglobus sp.]|nr:YihY family inner membrane protein [Halioglobus sp.]